MVRIDSRPQFVQAGPFTIRLQPFEHVVRRDGDRVTMQTEITEIRLTQQEYDDLSLSMRIEYGDRVRIVETSEINRFPLFGIDEDGIHVEIAEENDDDE